MHCFIFINYTYLHDIFSQCYIIQRAPPPPPLLPIGMICYYIYIFFSIIPNKNGDNFVQGYIKLKPLEYLVQTEVKMHLVLKKQNCTSKDFHFNSYVLLVHILKSFELQKKTAVCAQNWCEIQGQRMYHVEHEYGARAPPSWEPGLPVRVTNTNPVLPLHKNTRLWIRLTRSVFDPW